MPPYEEILLIVVVGMFDVVEWGGSVLASGNVALKSMNSP